MSLESPMYAYVVYEDGGRAIVHVSLIKNFNPQSTKDLAKSKNIYWRSKTDDDEEEGYYIGDVEELAVTKQELARKLQKRRIRWPDNVFDCAPTPPTELQTEPSRKKKQGRKKMAKRKRLEDLAADITSSEEEELIEKKILHKRTKKLEQEITSLRNKLSQERKKNSDLQQIVVKGMENIQNDIDAHHKRCRCQDKQKVTMPEENEPEGHIQTSATPLGIETANLGIISHAGLADPEADLYLMAPTALPFCSEEKIAFHPPDEVIRVAADNAASTTDDSLLGGGVSIPTEKWAHLMEQPKDSLFVRDTAKAIWGIQNLYNRSVTGAPCRRHLNKEGDPEGPERKGKKALTPKKLEALNNAFEKHLARHPSDVPSFKRRAGVNRCLADLLKVMVTKT